MTAPAWFVRPWCDLPAAGQPMRGAVPGTIPPVPKQMARREDRQMTGTGRHIRSRLRSWGHTLRTAAWTQLRPLMPPITPGVIFRALAGVLLFFCGILVGVWIIIRSRRHIQDNGS